MQAASSPASDLQGSPARLPPLKKKASQEDLGGGKGIVRAAHDKPWNGGTRRMDNWTSPPASPIRSIHRDKLARGPTTGHNARTPGPAFGGPAFTVHGPSQLHIEGGASLGGRATEDFYDRSDADDRGCDADDRRCDADSHLVSAPQLGHSLSRASISASSRTSFGGEPRDDFGADIVPSTPIGRRKKLLASALGTGTPVVRPFTTSGDLTDSSPPPWTTPAYALTPSTAILAARPLTTPNSPNAMAHQQPFGSHATSGTPSGSKRGSRGTPRRSGSRDVRSSREVVDKVWGFNTGSCFPILQENTLRSQTSFLATVEKERDAAPPALDVPLEAPWTKRGPSVFDKQLPVRSGGPFAEGEIDNAYWKLLKRAVTTQTLEGHYIEGGTPMRQRSLRRAITHDPYNPYA